MIADALKKALLQAAVQGKLTEQLPEDGDARDLLKEIQKEKARLVKEGQLKKEKPLPEIKEDDTPFDIPENWVWARLGDLVLLKSGQDMTPDKYQTKRLGIPYITGASNFNIGRVTIDRWTDSPKSIAREGDLLITCKGTVGEMAFLEEPQAHIARQVMAIKNVGKLNLKYIHFLLQWFVNELISMAKSLIPGISREMVLGIMTPLPPLLEQERIVQKLESLLPEIDSLKVEENKLNNLEKAFPNKIRSSILQAAIQGKLTDQLPSDGNAKDLLREIQKEKSRLIKEGKIKKEKPLPEITEDEIPFDIPERWVWARLGDCNEMMTGNSISKDVKAKKYSTHGDGLPYIATKDVSANYEIDYENGVCIPLYEPSFKTANKNSTLLCVEGGSAGRKIAMTDREVCFGNKLCKFEAWKINPKYVYYYLQTNEFTKLFKGEMTGIIGGVGIDRLKNVPICLPPLAEQVRIVQELDETLPLCDALD